MLNLGRLTKSQVIQLVRDMPPKFSGIVAYDVSHYNKSVKNDKIESARIVELYNKNSDEVFDKWGEVDLVLNRITVMAWDGKCQWQVKVYLYEDHFEIPEYRRGVYEEEIKKHNIIYKENLAKMIRYNSAIYYNG